ncbi:hypothetical protein [Lactobacillus terrae]|nr:hypothetical protein [Lactobacillus terrae]
MISIDVLLSWLGVAIIGSVSITMFIQDLAKHNFNIKDYFD